jgi:hypothetical protein
LINLRSFLSPPFAGVNARTISMGRGISALSHCICAHFGNFNTLVFIAIAAGPSRIPIGLPASFLGTCLAPQLGKRRPETTLKFHTHQAAGCTAVAIIAAVTVGACASARAEDYEIGVRRSAERTIFSDAEIKDGFFKTAFHAELQLDKKADRIRKFDEPVRVFVVNRGAPERRSQIAAIIADIRARVEHLDVAVTGDRKAANFVVTLVPERDLARTIAAHFGAAHAKRIQTALAPQCLSGIGKDETFRIRRAEAILPADVSDFSFYDCAYEELLQGLGIINDDNSVPWTMFNDDVQMGFFDVYDQHLVNILYDPRVQPGMTKAEVEAVLPDVLPAVRSWVTSTNSQADAPAEVPKQKYSQSERQTASK